MVIYNYEVKYYDNIFDKKVKIGTKSKEEANRIANRLKKQVKLMQHNTRVINGKPFTPYKNIRVKKLKCRL